MSVSIFSYVFEIFIELILKKDIWINSICFRDIYKKKKKEYIYIRIIKSILNELDRKLFLFLISS